MAHPLLCWDIIQEGNYRRADLKEDLLQLRKLAKLNDWWLAIDTVENKLVWENKVIIITNLNLHIQYASKNILQMNGYTEQEVIGKSPKIFQGEKTENEIRISISMAVKVKKSFAAIITNYKKDGSLYKCQIEVFPVLTKKNIITHFIAFENAIHQL